MSASSPCFVVKVRNEADKWESTVSPFVSPSVSLEEYYSEAGPDYRAWSRNFNMHFGYYRWGMNPFDREAMLERMNAEVLELLQLDPTAASRVLDLGCGLGATLRSVAARLPRALLTGVTRVQWQVERARERNQAAHLEERIEVLQADYEACPLPSAIFDAAYALESSCHAHGADKAALLGEAHRLLRPGGRLVVVDGFLRTGSAMKGLQRRIYKKLCDCWVIETLGELDAFQERLCTLGFRDIHVERWQLRVAPSVFHIPWVTLQFLWSDVLRGEQTMTRARWNNVLAPALLPLVSLPLGPMEYCMVSATKC